MIALLPVFPSESEAGLLRNILALPDHFLTRLCGQGHGISAIRAFCANEATAAVLREFHPGFRPEILAPGTPSDRFGARGAAACLKALGAPGQDEPVLVLDYRHPFLDPETPAKAMALRNGTGRPVLGLRTPRDHPVQLLSGQDTLGMETAVRFAPDFRFPGLDLGPLHPFVETPPPVEAACFSEPFHFIWPGHDPVHFNGALFALLRHGKIPAAPFFVPLSVLADYDPKVFRLAGVYFCESGETARRLFLETPDPGPGRSVVGGPFFGNMDAPGMFLVETPGGLVPYLPEGTLRTALRIKYALMAHGRGTVRDLSVPEDAGQSPDAFRFQGVRFVPATGEPLSSGTEPGTVDGIMAIPYGFSRLEADFPVPAVPECALWSQDWETGLAVNALTQRPVLGRQEFPAVHSPCPALLAATPGEYAALPSLLRAGKVAGLPLSESEALGISNFVELCRAGFVPEKTGAKPALAKPDATPRATPAPAAPDPAPEATPPAWDVPPPATLLDTAKFLAQALSGYGLGIMDEHRFLHSAQRALYSSAMHREHSADCGRARQERRMDALLDAAGTAWDGRGPALRSQLESACAENPLHPGLATLLDQTAADPEHRSWAVPLRRAWFIREIPLRRAPELGSPFSLVLGGDNMFYATGIGDTNTGPRTFRIDPESREAELLLDKTPYASVLPTPDGSGLLGLRFSGGMPFCPTLDVMDRRGAVQRTVDLSRPEHGAVTTAYFMAFFQGRLWLNDHATSRLVALDGRTFEPALEIRRHEFKSLASLSACSGEILAPTLDFQTVFAMTAQGGIRAIQAPALAETASLAPAPDGTGWYALQSGSPRRLRSLLAKLDQNFAPVFRVRLDIGYPAHVVTAVLPAIGSCAATLDPRRGFRLYSLDPDGPAARPRNPGKEEACS